jgi:hypothetical protein
MKSKDYTREALIKTATAKGVKGRHSMTKEQLCTSLQQKVSTPPAFTFEIRANRVTAQCRTSRDLYRLFRSSEVARWVTKAAFVNGSFDLSRGRVVLHGYAVYPGSMRRVAWTNIQCEQSGDLKHTPCVGANEKVFFKHAKTLGDYIEKIHSGSISADAHMRLFAMIHRVVGDRFENHNRDVEWLHFKSPLPHV